MKFLKINLRPVAAISILVFIILILIEPRVCTDGAANGIILSGRVIIPSLFPFTVCVLFIMRSGALSRLNFLSPVTQKLFHIPAELFSLLLLSFIGGYPIGAKLLNEAVINNKISKSDAGIMLNYCINAGPAFIVPAVGLVIIGSKTVGFVLLAAHITASLILSIVYGFFLKNDINSRKVKSQSFSVIDNFVSSTADSASAVLNICCYVILFSCINSYINLLADKLNVFRIFSYLTEVTNAIILTKNIPFISFLLGFGGFCVWMQVFSVGRKIKINYLMFIISRILHGLISAALTLLILKICKVALPVFNNGKIFEFNISYTSTALSISMLCMGIIFIISLYSKKFAGKLLEDLV